MIFLFRMNLETRLILGVKEHFLIIDNFWIYNENNNCYYEIHFKSSNFNLGTINA